MKHKMKQTFFLKLNYKLVQSFTNIHIVFYSY